MESITVSPGFGSKDAQGYGDSCVMNFDLKGYGYGSSHGQGNLCCEGYAWGSAGDCELDGAGPRLGRGTTKGTGYG